MKTQIIAITSVLLLAYGCKKEEPTEFKRTDVTGTTVVKGNVNKNVITPDGNGGWTSASAAKIPAAGVNVAITVRKNSLYPNSNAQGADVYNATTDENGNFSVNVRSNAQGVTAYITFEGFTGTLDTLVNGEIRTGLAAVFQGTSMTTTLIMGQPKQVDFSFDSKNVTSNPNTIKTGTALVTGSVSISFVNETLIDTNVVYGFVNVPVESGHKVYLSIDKDPYTQSTKIYETTTDENGNYSFQINTVEAGAPGFQQNVKIWVNDFAATRDTIRNNVRVPGPAGVFKMSSITENGVYNNSLKNALYVRYNTFSPN